MEPVRQVLEITFLSFYWYFLVGIKIIPLAIAPVMDAAPNGMLTGALMNVANVVTLYIPVATLILLEQAFNHISRFNILVYFSYFFLNGTCGGASGGADGRGGYVL